MIWRQIFFAQLSRTQYPCIEIRLISSHHRKNLAHEHQHRIQIISFYFGDINIEHILHEKIFWSYTSIYIISRYNLYFQALLNYFSLLQPHAKNNQGRVSLITTSNRTLHPYKPWLYKNQKNKELLILSEKRQSRRQGLMCCFHTFDSLP